jgi:hypothetical protein
MTTFAELFQEGTSRAPQEEAKPKLRLFSDDEKKAAVNTVIDLCSYRLKHFLGGSASLGLPAADIDVFVLVSDLDETAIQLERHDFVSPSFHFYTDKGFIPFRKGDLNIIAMDVEKDYDQTAIGHQVCQYLVSEGIIPTKEQRKVIHRILRGESTDFVTP